LEVINNKEPGRKEKGLPKKKEKGFKPLGIPPTLRPTLGLPWKELNKERPSKRKKIKNNSLKN